MPKNHGSGSTGADASLRAFVRALARQAARECFELELKQRSQDDSVRCKTVKVARYARYSSENQRDASIADQIRVCRVFAEREGWPVGRRIQRPRDFWRNPITTWLSGADAPALDRRVRVVLAESLDRFSRDQEDTAGLFKRLTFLGVRIFTLAEGEITHLHVGFKGTMNALFLKDLADKTLGASEDGRGGKIWRRIVLRLPGSEVGRRHNHRDG